MLHYHKRRCRASVFGIQTRLRSGRSGVRIRAGARDTSSSNRPMQPLLQWEPGFFPGSKAVGPWCWPITSI